MSLTVPTLDKRIRISEKVIHELVHRIGLQFQPKKIILFGPYAYGKPRPESDIDLLVIMGTPLKGSEQALQIRQYGKPLFGIDILVFTPVQLEQRLELGDSFLKEITTKGLVMYESPKA